MFRAFMKNILNCQKIHIWSSSRLYPAVNWWLFPAWMISDAFRRYNTDLCVCVFPLQWAPLTSASITCRQAAAAWAAPTASLLRTLLTCTERVTHWVAAQTPWRNGRGPSAARAPSETALTKVGHTLKVVQSNVLHVGPSCLDTIKDNFRATFS